MNAFKAITNLGPGPGAPLSQFSYGDNAAGDITSWLKQTGTNNADYQFGYDAADQLLSATYSERNPISC